LKGPVKQLAESLGPDDLKSLDRAHNFYSWSIQGAISPMLVSRADGMYVYDAEGEEYLDFSSQLVNTNIGHSHPKVVSEIQKQAEKLATIGPAYSSEPRVLAAKSIVDLAGPGFQKVFFTNGGADAVENAIRAARLYTGRPKILSSYRSYHGNTGAAIVATGDWRRQPNEYASHHIHFFGPFLYRSEFWAQSEEEECERALRHLERVVQSEGPETIAAILLESVPGTAGILVPPTGYLKGVKLICDRYGILLILDEVMCGFGRTGQWFAFHDQEVTPDLITFAKGVNSGYVPVGGVVFSKQISDFFEDSMFPGGLTYSGHPLAMASINAALQAMHDEKIIENARKIGDESLRPGLLALQERHQVIGEVRGLGCFFALDLVSDSQTRAVLEPAAMAKIREEIVRAKLLPFAVDNRIHVVPPLIVTSELVDEALNRYEHALSAAGF